MTEKQEICVPKRVLKALLKSHSEYSRLAKKTEKRNDAYSGYWRGKADGLVYPINLLLIHAGEKKKKYVEYLP
jgi:hypothetical protein